MVKVLATLVTLCLPSLLTGQECVDTDGDGWGWDGAASCLVTTLNATEDCVDSDSDGWGWNGTESCRLTTDSLQDEVPSLCIDTDGDGWGWNGTESCRLTTDSLQDEAPSLCIDTDGDGWGWNGVASCLPFITASPASGTGTCIELEGDEWEGTQSCTSDSTVNGESVVEVIVQPSPVTTGADSSLLVPSTTVATQYRLYDPVSAQESVYVQREVMAIKGTTAIVGGAQVEGTETFADYVFYDKNDGQWQPSLSVTHPRVFSHVWNDHFSYTDAAIDGDHALVSDSTQGIIYVYRRSIAGWQQTAALTQPDDSHPRELWWQHLY